MSLIIQELLVDLFLCNLVPNYVRDKSLLLLVTFKYLFKNYLQIKYIHFLLLRYIDINLGYGWRDYVNLVEHISVKFIVINKILQ